jgi:hypothetical protein
MRVDFMVSHYWGLWRQSCALCFFTSRAALRRPQRRPSALLPDKAASTCDVYQYPGRQTLIVGSCTSASGPGRVKTKSNLVVALSGGLCPVSDGRRPVAMGPSRHFSMRYKVGFDALKMYRLLLKKYLPASLKCSNSPCQSLRSSAETSFLPATKFRTICANPQL